MQKQNPAIGNNPKPPIRNGDRNQTEKAQKQSDAPDPQRRTPTCPPLAEEAAGSPVTAGGGGGQIAAVDAAGEKGGGFFGDRKSVWSIFAGPSSAFCGLFFFLYTRQNFEITGKGPLIILLPKWGHRLLARR